MSATAVPSSDTGKDPVQHRSRARRGSLIMLFPVLLVLLAGGSLGLDWYQSKLPDTAVGANHTTNVVSNPVVTITGWELAHQAPVPAAVPGVPDGLVPPPRVPSNVNGVPSAFLWLVAIALISLLLTVFRSPIYRTALVLAGLLCNYFAWSGYLVFRMVVEDPKHGGEFVTALTGVNLYGQLTATVAVSFVVCFIAAATPVFVASTRVVSELNGSVSQTAKPASAK